MLSGIKFINREAELNRLMRLARSRVGGLAVVYGRRRMGKSRLLLEWSKATDGLLFAADESEPTLQRKYCADALGRRLPRFADAHYPDWKALLSRLAADAKAAGFRGPIVIDEFPALAASSPELPSVMQNWIDHEASDAGLVVAISGSSQRMMQGIVLDGDAPLFGRATELFQVRPLHPRHLREALGSLDGLELLDAWTAWGGVPRYLALAAAREAPTRDCVDALVLDPGGPLHDEVPRLLLEESPPAADLRATLDVIGGGAHRVSEIAGRLGKPATALGRPRDRLQGLELICRETPFGTSERDTKRSLYRLNDPFFRLWFRCVSPHRGFLLQATPAQRREHLAHHWAALRAEAFEQLCRMLVPALRGARIWGVAQRWWQGSAPELDVVAASQDGTTLLVGEVRALAKPLTQQTAKREVQDLLSRPISKGLMKKALERVLFVPRVEKGCPRRIDGVWLVEMDDLVEGRWPVG